jgi:hypothetical protein
VYFHAGISDAQKTKVFNMLSHQLNLVDMENGLLEKPNYPTLRTFPATDTKSEDWTTDCTNPAHPGYMILAKTDPNHPGYMILAKTAPNHPGYKEAALIDPTHPGFNPNS